MLDVSSIIMIVAVLAAMYFLMLRPESKKKKEYKRMMDELAVGDKITTIGGMVGKVVNISDSTVTFESGEDRVRIEVTREAISSKVAKTAD